MKQLSIIIPIYNVEAYIRECLESVFRQGMSDDGFEVILVNDGTPDNSMTVISDIIEQHDNIIVIHQTNQGVSAARNAGLRKATGSYVYFMDPDDLLVNQSLSVLVTHACSASVDILMADYVKFDDADSYQHLLSLEQQYSETPKSAAEAFIGDLSPYECYIWRMIIRRDFLIDNQIDFKPFWYEDTLFCQECYLKARRCIKASYTLYVYRLHAGSFTSKMSVSKLLDLNSALVALYRLKDLEGITEPCKKRLMDNIFSSFNYGLYCITHHKELFEARHVIVSDLRQKLGTSTFFFTNNMKQMVVSVAFRYMPDTYLSLRYTLR